MPAGPRPRREPTDDWDQLRLLVATLEQETYELLRPVVHFGQSTRARAWKTGVPERSLRRKVARFAAVGMRSLFAQDPEPARDRRRLPAAIRVASSSRAACIRWALRSSDREPFGPNESIETPVCDCPRLCVVVAGSSNNRGASF